MIAVYIPCKDEDEAEKIARHLLSKKLIACANIWPVRSLYKWKGEIADEREVVILVKSAEEKYLDIIEEACSVHSYDIPAIVKFNVKANKEYEKWLRNEANQ